MGFMIICWEYIEREILQCTEFILIIPPDAKLVLMSHGNFLRQESDSALIGFLLPNHNIIMRHIINAVNVVVL